MTTRTDRVCFVLAVLLAWGFWAGCRWLDWIDTPWWQLALFPVLLAGYTLWEFVPAVASGLLARRLGRRSTDARTKT